MRTPHRLSNFPKTVYMPLLCLDERQDTFDRKFRGCQGFKTPLQVYRVSTLMSLTVVYLYYHNQEQWVSRASFGQEIRWDIKFSQKNAQKKPRKIFFFKKIMCLGELVGQLSRLQTSSYDQRRYSPIVFFLSKSPDYHVALITFRSDATNLNWKEKVKFTRFTVDFLRTVMFSVSHQWKNFFF